MSRHYEIKTIAMVGASSAVYRGNAADDQRYTYCVDYLRRSGISVKTEPAVDLIDLNAARDFLAEKHRYHLVILNRIPDPPPQMASIIENMDWLKGDFKKS